MSERTIDNTPNKTPYNPKNEARIKRYTRKKTTEFSNFGDISPVIPAKATTISVVDPMKRAETAASPSTIAPTMLKVMGLPKPAEMDGESLIK